MITSRRGFLAGLGSLFVAAPAIVRAASLMPVRAFDTTDYAALETELRALAGEFISNVHDNLFGDLIATTRKAFIPRLYVQLHQNSSLMDWLVMREVDLD